MKFSQALLDDLARSALDRRDALAMKLEDISASLMNKRVGIELPGYLIPYPAVFEREPFGRYRFLASAEELAAQNLDPKNRYRQMAGTGCRLYLPPLAKGRQSWQAVAQDTKVRLSFLEGEKKAYTLVSRAREYTIGLGGVSNWAPEKVEGLVITSDGAIKPKKGRPAKPRISRLPLKEFNFFDWRNRIVIIGFDWPDVVINNNVRLERERFAAFLAKQGADVRVVDFADDLNSEKIAPDDFIKIRAPKLIQNCSTTPSRSRAMAYLGFARAMSKSRNPPTPTMTVRRRSLLARMTFTARPRIWSLTMMTAKSSPLRRLSTGILSGLRAWSSVLVTSR
jgi:hypothetical protein